MSVRTPIIAIVGRPNVGKSTFFNHIIGQKLAIVEDIAGVTRDRNYFLCERYSVPFFVIDTGGFEKTPDDEMAKHVVEQTIVATEEADVVLAVFDAKQGVQVADEEVMSFLRASKKPIYYIVNKVDGHEQELRKVDFYSLGIEELHDVSALNGRNVCDLIEKVLNELPNYESLRQSFIALREQKKSLEALARLELEKASEQIEKEVVVETVEEVEEFLEPEFAPVHILNDSSQSEKQYLFEYRNRSEAGAFYGNALQQVSVEDEINQLDLDKIEYPSLTLIKVAIIGRPNVGKSTLLNTLTGVKRAITSDIAGTTRDNLDSRIRRDGQEFALIDTAGLRKKARVSDKIERYSTLRSLRAISECDVALVLLDATSGPVEQDAKIVGLAHEQGKGIVFAVNKWDLVEKDHKSVVEFKKQMEDVFKFAPYAPVVFISALNGKRCPKVIDTVRQVALERVKRVPTPRLNKLLERTVRKHTPPVYRGEPIKLYYGVQVDIAPPRFALFFNHPKEVHFSYLRYLKNAIRDQFDFSGSDLKFSIRKR